MLYILFKKKRKRERLGLEKNGKEKKEDRKVNKFLAGLN